MYLLEKLKLQIPYTLLATQKGKTAISQQLVETVHRMGGRFVARDDDDIRWYEVDDSVARRKASQTLREDKTPSDQESKRKTLLRKLKDMDQQPQQPGSTPVVSVTSTTNHLSNHEAKSAGASLDEQKASETLLELNSCTASGGGTASCDV